MATLKIPTKTLTDNFNLQDFKDDFNALNIETTDWTNFKANGGTIGGELTSNLVYLKDKTNNSGYYGLQYDTDGKLGVHYFNSSGTWVKRVMALDKTGEDLFFGSFSNCPNGYTKLPNGMIMQWGAGSITLVNGKANIPIGTPIAFPNSVFTHFINCDGINDQNSLAQPQMGLSMSFYTKGAFNVYAEDLKGANNYKVNFTWIAIGY